MDTLAIVAPILAITGAISSAGASVAAGQQQATLLEAEAKQKQFAAKQEIVNAKEQVNTIQRQLIEDIATQNASFAARGILSSSPSVLAAVGRSAQNATRDIQVARAGGVSSSFTSSAEASVARSQKTTARTTGVLNAIPSLARGASLIPQLKKKK